MKKNNSAAVKVIIYHSQGAGARAGGSFNDKNVKVLVPGVLCG
jgi:hypothetical protein